MRLWHLVALGAALAVPAPANAQLHLGMKLACKRYGDAFKSGRQAEVAAACTPAFGRCWTRLPADAFADLPRGGNAQLIATKKNGNTGFVTARTAQGVVTFVMEGQGFDWLVADIRRTDERGQTISVREFMEVTLTANEFIVIEGAGKVYGYAAQEKVLATDIYNFAGLN